MLIYTEITDHNQSQTVCIVPVLYWELSYNFLRHSPSLNIFSHKRKRLLVNPECANQPSAITEGNSSYKPLSTMSRRTLDILFTQRVTRLAYTQNYINSPRTSSQQSNIFFRRKEIINGTVFSNATSSDQQPSQQVSIHNMILPWKGMSYHGVRQETPCSLPPLTPCSCL